MTRFAPLALCLSPCFAWADDFTLRSPVTAATVFPYGAIVTHTATATLPAGRHRIFLPDWPAMGAADVTGMTLNGGVVLSSSHLDTMPLTALEDSEEVAKLRADVDQITDALQDMRARAKALRLAGEAATTQIGFLQQLGKGQGLASLSVEELRELSRMIGDETLAARQRAGEAERAALAIDREIKDMQDALEDAKQRLSMASPILRRGDGAGPVFATEIETDGGEITLSVRALDHGASWQPSYELRLADGDAPRVPIHQRAIVDRRDNQLASVPWTDVALTLATSVPTGQLGTGIPHSWRRYIESKSAKLSPRARSMAEYAEEAQAEAMVVQDSEIASNSNGIDFTYQFEFPVSIHAADSLTLNMESYELAARVYAKAVPLWQETAFVAAEIVNDTGSLFLPSISSTHYNGDVLAGLGGTPMIAPGETVELQFGRIHGMKLTRTVLDRQEGDSGVITRSNHEEEQVSIKVENLTGRAWDVELFDRVPYSEQEDLVISWDGVPEPVETDMDGRRGVLRWDFRLDPGETRALRLDTVATWPDGHWLR